MQKTAFFGLVQGLPRTKISEGHVEFGIGTWTEAYQSTDDNLKFSLYTGRDGKEFFIQYSKSGEEIRKVNLI